MKLLSLIGLVICSFGCTNSQSNQKNDTVKAGLDTTTDMYHVTSEDASMNAAITRAKFTISEFDKALASNDPSYSDFAVKKKYNTSDGGFEHMWVAGISLANGNYKGFINNDAELTTEVKYGDTVILRKDEITDWMYLANNVLKGGYTIKDIRNKLTKAERDKMDKDLGFIIED